MKIYWYVFIVCLLLSSCHKEEKITTDKNAQLTFSTDTIFFDTLFTSVSSVTKRLKVYNKNSNAVIISSIDLGGKSTSSFQLIINGLSSYYQNNVELRGGDSLYVLVKATIDPKNKNLPFLVSDSISFQTNGNTQRVQLLAYGQDAAFYKSATVACDTVWMNTKPYVIYDYARVAPGCTLTIDEGVRVYFHDQAYLKVEGTLIVKGLKDSLVTFTGDHFTSAYEDLPGQWTGIEFESSSKNNSISYCKIRNATTGIEMKYDPADNDTIADLTLANTIVENMKLKGVQAEGRDVIATNCLFRNAVQQAFAGVGGGNYYLDFCTLANYSYDFFREDVTLEFNNSDFVNNTNLVGDLNARVTKSIIWGDDDNEISLLSNKTNGFNFYSSQCIIKTTRTDLNINGNLINKDPQFVSPVLKDYHLATGSPAIDAATASSVTIDLEGKPRDVNPDIGAYEK
jgi:hypothetical protein